MSVATIIFLIIFSLPLLFFSVKLFIFSKNNFNKIFGLALFLAWLYLILRYRQAGYVIDNFWFK